MWPGMAWALGEEEESFVLVFYTCMRKMDELPFVPFVGETSEPFEHLLSALWSYAQIFRLRLGLRLLFSWDE